MLGGAGGLLEKPVGAVTTTGFWFESDRVPNTIPNNYMLGGDTDNIWYAGELGANRLVAKPLIKA